MLHGTLSPKSICSSYSIHSSICHHPCSQWYHPNHRLTNVSSLIWPFIPQVGWEIISRARWSILVPDSLEVLRKWAFSDGNESWGYRCRSSSVCSSHVNFKSQLKALTKLLQEAEGPANIARPQIQFPRTTGYKDSHRQSLCVGRFAQDNSICWYLAVLQRLNFKDFFCILVASMRTGTALAATVLETLESDSETRHK